MDCSRERVGTVTTCTVPRCSASPERRLSTPCRARSTRRVVGSSPSRAPQPTSPRAASRPSAPPAPSSLGAAASRVPTTGASAGRTTLLRPTAAPGSTARPPARSSRARTLGSGAARSSRGLGRRRVRAACSAGLPRRCVRALPSEHLSALSLSLSLSISLQPYCTRACSHSLFTHSPSSLPPLA